MAVTRSPYKRMASVYKWWLEKKRLYQGYAFNEMVRILIRQSDEYWLADIPSSKEAKQGLSVCKYITELDDKAELIPFEKVSERFPGMKHIHYVEDRTHYSRFYDAGTRKLVAEHFADDIERFGYEFSDG